MRGIKMERRARDLLTSLDVRIRDISAPVAALSGGQRQSVAITRALLGDPRLVILDEPTAALGVEQTAQVLDLVKRLRDRGLAVMVISHNLADVRAVSDRIVVLRLGRNAGDFRTADTSQEAIVAAITGLEDTTWRQ
jgi:D-xylose transport system ATP-binding protein